jgi:hypothetical protein
MQLIVSDEQRGPQPDPARPRGGARWNSLASSRRLQGQPSPAARHSCPANSSVRSGRVKLVGNRSNDV